MRSIAVKLPSQLVDEVRRYAETFSRSLPKQIEYWIKIGKIAEENPDLPYDFIKKILLAINEDPKTFEQYQFDDAGKK